MADPAAVIESAIKSEEQRIKDHVTRWLQDIDIAVKGVRDYMSAITLESKFMVDEYESRVSDTKIELQPSSREPVVYEFIVTSMSVAGTLIIGRRRFPIPVGITSLNVKMRVGENEQRILLAGTPEAGGATGPMYFEMTGHMYPHVSY